MRHKALNQFFKLSVLPCGLAVCFAFSILTLNLSAWAAADQVDTKSTSQIEYAEISHPVLSGHCQNLLQQRQQKIEFRNRIGALIFRNQSIRERLAPHQHTLRHNLDVNRRSLDREYHLALLKIQKMTEDILRRGCPGIEIQ
ncbi:MAG: hypothetical protein J6Y94_04080 [Bacteriovoracaceae bacterium]|nr:hypothetical protein [Bacteriovoracaceae bacterium]